MRRNSVLEGLTARPDVEEAELDELRDTGQDGGKEKGQKHER